MTADLEARWDGLEAPSPRRLPAGPAALRTTPPLLRFRGTQRTGAYVAPAGGPARIPY